MDDRALLQKYLENPSFTEKLGDIIRLLDPVEKKVYSCLNADSEFLSDEDSVCYGFWEQNKACENCVSMRAYTQKRTTIKIEYKDPYIYMITAVPFDFEGRSMVVELIKNITKDGIISIAGMEPEEIGKLVNKRNLSIIKDAVTRIYNEQFIYERLPFDILRSNQKDQNVVLFLIKLKNLENINGIYGFNMGDHIIKEAAKELRNFQRNEDDWASRYRSNEFVLVMHELSENQIKRICKQIYDKINELKFSGGEEELKIEISIGYHSIKYKIITPEDFIEIAGKMSCAESTPVKTQNAEIFNSHLLQPFLLTFREKEVAVLLLDGKTNTEISKALYIGLSTVKKHVSSIFEKTEVKSRTEFFAMVNGR